MKFLASSIRLAFVTTLLVVITSCATTQNREAALTAAGFKTKVARTTQQQEHLQSLPSGKVTMVQRDGKTYYVFPDKVHNVAYVGTPDQYQAYEQTRLADQAANTDLETADRNDPAARTNAQTSMLHDQEFHDQAMGWGSWGQDFWQ